MSHLTLETLARLVDEPANAHETRHLEECAACRGELDALREDVQALKLLPDVVPPSPGAWDALEMRLVAEGVMRSRQTAAPAWRPWLARAAAAVVVFAAGTLAGRITAAPVVQFAQAPAPQAVLAGSTTDTAPVAGDVLAADAPALDYERAPSPGSGVTLASQQQPAARPVAPRTMDEAAQVLRQTEEQYLRALTRYAEMATQAEAGDPIARLAALQSIVMTTQAALSQTPTDPVINGYHLTALAQRDAALRQVAASTGERWY